MSGDDPDGPWTIVVALLAAVGLFVSRGWSTALFAVILVVLVWRSIMLS